MRISFNSARSSAATQGKGASRRLRHTGKVPAILYGGHKDAAGPVARSAEPADDDRRRALLFLDRASEGRRQHAGGHRQGRADAPGEERWWCTWTCSACVENEQIRIRLPIHFKGESISPGVKTQGGVVSHLRTDVEISCLPKDLPEFLELDLSGMHLNETKFLAGHPAARGRGDPRAHAAATRRSSRSTRRVPRSRSRWPPRLRPRPPRVQRLPAAGAGAPGQRRGLRPALPRAMPRRARRRRTPLAKKEGGKK